MADFTTRLTKAASGFMYSFMAREQGTHEELFRFEASRLQHTRGGVLADVTVFSPISTARVIPGTLSHYVTRQVIDLLSARSKADFASLLGQLIPSPSGAAPIDWAVTIEEFGLAVLDAEHEKPKVLDLSVVVPTFDTPYLVPYLIPIGKPTILYGAGGTGKSIFASALAAAVQEEQPVLGWTTTQANVLYLDWETDEGDLSRRNALASAGIGLTRAASVRYMRPGNPLNEHDTLAHVATIVKELDIGLVVVDSVVMASKPKAIQADPAEAAIDFFKAVNMLGCSVLAIDHIAGEDMRKKSTANKPYGSVFKWNIARNVFQLEAPDDEPDTLILKHRKSNIGPRMDNKTLTMQWRSIEDGGVSFTDSAKAFKYAMPTTTRVLTALDMNGACVMSDLLRHLEAQVGYDPLNSTEVGIAIKSLESQGLARLDAMTGKVVLTSKVIYKS